MVPRFRSFTPIAALVATVLTVASCAYPFQAPPPRECDNRRVECPPVTVPKTTLPDRPLPRPTTTSIAPTTAPPTTQAPPATAPPTTAPRPTVPPAPPARGNKPVVPANGAYFGLWIKPHDNGHNMAAIQAQWNAREADLGRTADISHNYYTFDAPFPSWHEPWHHAKGTTPMISWNGTSSSSVNSGQQDGLIRTRARAVKALGFPVFLRYFWEPEAKKKLPISESPAAYIANWRRVHRIFAEEGVTNAAWVWCPTSWGFKAGTAQPYYPGDDVVDWICSDGYNWGSSKSPSAWTDWNTIYGAFYAFGQAHGKPMMAGEWGSVEGSPGAKAQWMRTTRNQIKGMPGIKAVVYFDSRRIENGVWVDWRVESSSSAYSAFDELADDPYFNR